ncbi:MAG: low temperature requirement protein A [Acidothermales bacterium]|nr:low temperature requirement protein A [Acidothermales bacterium]
MTGERPAPRPWRMPMVGRSRDEEHRASTPLELLFDLCFVVAVSQAAAALHQGVADGHAGSTLLGYLMVFFAIWWAWMNFTWFASAYDTDDVPYRLLTLTQIAGVLVLAAGVHSAFLHYDFRAITVGYVIMRAAMIAQWTRAAVEHTEGRRTAVRYAVGIGVVQVGWVLRLLLPGGWGLLGFAVLVGAELAVPVAAEPFGRRTSWHPDHIVERYGLFTLIVLGEVVLAATSAVQAAVAARGLSAALLLLSAGGLLLVFGLWWSYFKRPATEGLRGEVASSFVWGYTHYFAFAAVAALGAGLQVAAGAVEHSAGTGPVAAFAVAVPVGVFLVVAGSLQTLMGEPRAIAYRFVAVALLVQVAAAAAGALTLAGAILLMGVLVSTLVVTDVLLAARHL